MRRSAAHPTAAHPTAAHETAAHLLTDRVPTARADVTAGALRRSLEGRRFDTAEMVYVLDEEGRLTGCLHWTDLLAAPADEPVAPRLVPPRPQVPPETDQEAVAHAALDAEVAEVAVAVPGGRFLGVVPAARLLHVLRREHVEDVHRMAGIRREDARALSALVAPPVRRARDRLPWLLVGLAGSGLATLIVSRFEGLLESRVAIAFFLPAIVYLADAVGTQTEAIAVRGLSRVHRPLAKLLGPELRTGALMGGLLGALAGLGVWLGFRDARLALAIALSLFLATSIASGVGLLLPWWLSRLGRDPAFGSGPLGTILQDVLSILVYFGVVALLLG